MTLPEKNSRAHAVCLALGANLGDRRANLERGLSLLREQVTLDAVSPWYETAPVGGAPGDGNYLNGAARGFTALAPGELVAFCLEVEKRCGRVRPAPRWSARTLDIDVLFYDAAVINRPPEVIIPHPRLSERAFVLQPLNDIAPSWRHPSLGLTVREMWEKIRAAAE